MKIKKPGKPKISNNIKKVSKSNSPWRGFLIYGLLTIAVFAIFYIFSAPQAPGTSAVSNIGLSDAIKDIRDGKVANVEVDGNKATLTYKDTSVKSTRKEDGQGFLQALDAAKVDPTTVSIEIKDRSVSQAVTGLLGAFLPLLLMVVFFFFIFRQAREGASSVFSFGQSRAKLFSRESPQVTFSDVAGVDEAKQELTEVVDFLRHPEKFKALGARTPKGALLVGPAGTGKTLLARAVAGEAGVPFFSVAGSEFMEMLVGVGAARVRDLFDQAKKSGSSIIFIDEIESIGRMRGMGFSGGHDEREQTLNQILVEMDGFTPNDNVIVVAATNRPDLLDPALVRPGRFDRRVILDLPDIEGRKAIIDIHMKGKPFEKDADFDKLARRTVGFSGADLSNMLNEAAILAAREGKKAIDNKDLEEAATKVKMGPQRKRLQTDEEKTMTAYHEGGHAIVAHFSPHMDPVHRISIVSRGMTGGHTLIPPMLDRQNEHKSHLLEMIATALGGRGAEEIVYGDVSTGASSDLETATNIARQMVVDFGMSELGPISLGQRTSFGTWSAEGDGKQVSEQLASKIDSEIKRIIDAAYKQALKTIHDHRKQLEKVTLALVKVETMESDEFEKLVGAPKPKPRSL